MEDCVRSDETMQEINGSLKLISKKDGLKFGTDAYLLAAFVRKDAGKRVADLGSGTGVIPLLLHHYAKCEKSIAVEIIPEFADLIARNADMNGFKEKMTVLCRDVRDVAQKDIGGAVDYVVCNPPYLKADAGKLNNNPFKVTARHETSGGISDFCKAAAALVKSGGLVYFVYRPERLTALMSAMKDFRLEPKRTLFVQSDIESMPSLVLVEAQSGAAEGLRILPALITFQDAEHRIYTARYQAVYDHCRIADPELRREQ